MEAGLMNLSLQDVFNMETGLMNLSTFIIAKLTSIIYLSNDQTVSPEYKNIFLTQ